MKKQNKTGVKNGSRRLFAAFFLMILCFAAFWLVEMDPMELSIIPEESTIHTDWEGILCSLGYSLRKAEQSPESNKDDVNLQLYANAAVLLDADSGRVLYGKNEDTPLPMASTTKIMTCIVALENGNLDDIVAVSSYAASQPEVRLGIRSGEAYTLKDLLYAMMLTSYNDCAVAIAEHIGGSAEGFAEMMNEKAKDLGCYSTWFITANGLDAENEGGVHRTTATDLAKILAYAIQNETFLKITQTSSHSFTDHTGKRSFTAVNKNAFLSMMSGVLSGKTGFTNDAGYCYAGALSQDGKTLVAVVLGSGWPPHKTRKWSDTKALMNYGLKTYSPTVVGDGELVTEVTLPVVNGVAGTVKVELDWSERTMLMKEGEAITASVYMTDKLTAPVTKGAIVGYINLYLEGDSVLLIPAIVTDEVEEISFSHCFEHIFAYYFDISPKL